MSGPVYELNILKYLFPRGEVNWDAVSSGMKSLGLDTPRLLDGDKMDFLFF
jgi:hypothetical protein